MTEIFNNGSYFNADIIRGKERSCGRIVSVIGLRNRRPKIASEFHSKKARTNFSVSSLSIK
jgi:hypothetical protein